MNHNLRRCYGPPILVLALAAPWCGSFAAEPPEDLPGTVRIAEYEASAFSYHETGTLLWLAGPDGILRLEIRRGDSRPKSPNPLPPLLEQEGQGWTAILAGEGNDTLNAWGEEWRRPPRGLARVAQVVSGALLAGPPVAAVETSTWRAGAVANHRQKERIPTLDGDRNSTGHGVEFRRRQTHRGLGRGGADEMLELVWKYTDRGRTPRLQVAVTRRPGHLELSLIGFQDVVYAMPEAFVPLWPLGQLVSLVR